MPGTTIFDRFETIRSQACDPASEVVIAREGDCILFRKGSTFLKGQTRKQWAAMIPGLLIMLPSRKYSFTSFGPVHPPAGWLADVWTHIGFLALVCLLFAWGSKMRQRLANQGYFAFDAATREVVFFCGKNETRYPLDSFVRCEMRRDAQPSRNFSTSRWNLFLITKLGSGVPLRLPLATDAMAWQFTQLVALLCGFEASVESTYASSFHPAPALQPGI